MQSWNYNPGQKCRDSWRGSLSWERDRDFFLINEFTTATANTTIDQQTVLLWDTNLKKYSNVKH